MLINKIKVNKENIGYGVSIALLFALLQWLELRFVMYSEQLELYVGIIALIFTALGGWLVFSLLPKVKSHEQKPASITFVFNKDEALQRNISKRELEVLQLMEKGMSNKEIADQLFVSVNTIKTHASNLFEKLESKRRLQAITTAKKLNLLP
ncbi:MAG: LuxR C-terminal-related transcriptional regulator [Flavobacterium sp.]|nr:LuxR C-terminal-related transcriptional regulator [Flavobacterium sp.]